MGEALDGVVVWVADAPDPVGVVAVEAVSHDGGEEVGVVQLGDGDEPDGPDRRGGVLDAKRGRDAAIPAVEPVLHTGDAALALPFGQPRGAVRVEQVVDLALDVGEIDPQLAVVEGAAVVDRDETEAVGGRLGRKGDVYVDIRLDRRDLDAQGDVLVQDLGQPKDARTLRIVLGRKMLRRLVRVQPQPVGKPHGGADNYARGPRVAAALEQHHDVQQHLHAQQVVFAHHQLRKYCLRLVHVVIGPLEPVRAAGGAEGLGGRRPQSEREDDLDGGPGGGAPARSGALAAADEAHEGRAVEERDDAVEGGKVVVDDGPDVVEGGAETCLGPPSRRSSPSSTGHL